MLLAKRAIRRKNLNGIAAMSGGLATIAFFIIGFALHGWAWGWIVFLIPPMIHRYLAMTVGALILVMTALTLLGEARRTTAAAGSSLGSIP